MFSKKNKFSQQDKMYLMLAMFIGAVLTANFLGGKITAFDLPTALAVVLNTIFWPIIFILNILASPLPDHGILTDPFIIYNFFNTIHVSVGILTVPVMFLVTDVVAEVKGKTEARKFVNVGIITMIFVLIITIISVMLPADPTRAWFSQDAYEKIFGTTIRIIIASIVAFALAQYHDVWAFHFWKEKTKGRFLWFRNNASTFVSQFIDSTVFMFIAFYGPANGFDAIFIFSLILPYWIFKILFAMLDTPLVYTGVRWLKEK